MEKQVLISESFGSQYERNAHSVGASMWHIEWCTKYRYKMMKKGENQKLMEACIRRSASENKIKILEIAVEPEHIHCVIEIKFEMRISKAFQILKGGSSYRFFRKKPQFRKRYPKGHFWSPGKFAVSVGFIQLEKAREYVRNQKIHHN